MKQVFRDKRGVKIVEPGEIKFKLEDEVEEKGYFEYTAPVKIHQGMLGYYSAIEKRVIPFRENYPDGLVDNAVYIG